MHRCSCLPIYVHLQTQHVLLVTQRWSSSSVPCLCGPRPRRSRSLAVQHVGEHVAFVRPSWPWCGSPWVALAEWCGWGALLGGEPTRDEPACVPEACFCRDLGRVSKQKWPQRRSGTAIVPFARTPSVPPNPRVSSDCGSRQTVRMLARSSEPGRPETSRT